MKEGESTGEKGTSSEQVGGDKEKKEGDEGASSEKVEKKEGLIQWTQTGQHNVRNAMAAAAAAGHVGIDVSVSCEAFVKFD